MCKEKLLFISPRVWDAGARGWEVERVVQETMLNMKTLFSFCPLFGAPLKWENWCISEKKDGVRAVEGELVEQCPPSEQGSEAPSLKFPDGESLTWLNPFSFRGVPPQAKQGNLPVVSPRSPHHQPCWPELLYLSFLPPLLCLSLWLFISSPLDSCHILSFLQDCCHSVKMLQISYHPGKPCRRVEAMPRKESRIGLGVPPLQLSA